MQLQSANFDLLGSAFGWFKPSTSVFPRWPLILAFFSLTCVFLGGNSVGFARNADSIPVERHVNDRVVIVEPNLKSEVEQTSEVDSRQPVPVESSIAQGTQGVQSASDWRQSPVIQIAADDTGRHSGSESGQSAEDQRFWELYHQVQLLNEELRELRGMLEVIQNEARQLDKKQARNYVDLDERLSKLEGGQTQSARPAAGGSNLGSPNAVGSSNKPVMPQATQPVQQQAGAKAVPLNVTKFPQEQSKESTTVVPEQPADQALAAAGGEQKPSVSEARGDEPNLDQKLSEKSAYDKVYDLLAKRDFDAARDGFRQFVEDYPKGQLRGNALYWLAELSLRQEKPEEEAALGYIEQLIKEYPSHARIPDALYKQATLKYRQDDVQAASKIYTQIVEKHPNTTAARLADHQLRRLAGAME